jgi:hypothetical protein
MTRINHPVRYRYVSAARHNHNRLSKGNNDRQFGRSSAWNYLCRLIKSNACGCGVRRDLDGPGTEFNRKCSGLGGILPIQMGQGPVVLRSLIGSRVVVALALACAPQTLLVPES